MEEYDFIVIGGGPAGHFAAIQATKSGASVALIERAGVLGGTAAVTGTVPSKALRESVLHLTGHNQQLFRGDFYRVKKDITIEDLTMSSEKVIANEVQVLQHQLERNHVRVVYGAASFVGPHQVVTEGPEGVRVFKGKKIMIATGSRPADMPGIEYDGERVINSNQILKIKKLPKSMIVIGAGVIGIEYASMFGALGVQVTLLNATDQILNFADRQLVSILCNQLQYRNVDIRLGESVAKVTPGVGKRTLVHTESNKVLSAELVLCTTGRQGNTDELTLEAAGLEADSRGRISVNEHLQTEQEHIYAGGDVIGFPALAATSREQGRRAACHAFNMEKPPSQGQLPYGIYAIPEISMIGPTEEELTAKGVRYEVGRAFYREIARGHLQGDTTGLLKILFDPATFKIIAIHVIGESATELVHIGQAIQALDGTLHYLADTVFNYPTFAECYKVAAFDGLNKVRRSQSPEEATAEAPAEQGATNVQSSEVASQAEAAQQEEPEPVAEACQVGFSASECSAEESPVAETPAVETQASNDKPVADVGVEISTAPMSEIQQIESIEPWRKAAQEALDNSANQPSSPEEETA